MEKQFEKTSNKENLKQENIKKIFFIIRFSNVQKPLRFCNLHGTWHFK